MIVKKKMAKSQSYKKTSPNFDKNAILSHNYDDTKSHKYEVEMLS